MTKIGGRETQMRYLFAVNDKPVEFHDLDLRLAAKVELTESEVTILRYFHDIEQGVGSIYLPDINKTAIGQDPEVQAFLTVWGNQEKSHAQALRKLLNACGYLVSDQPRRTYTIRSYVQNLTTRLISYVFPKELTAVYAAWGASQELSTLLGYQRIVDTTNNPVLRQLADRIRQQESRHFSWYYNQAKKRLEESKKSQIAARWIFNKIWSPVGVGVKTQKEYANMVGQLFPGESMDKMIEKVDSKISKLTGLAGITPMETYHRNLRKQGLLRYSFQGRYTVQPKERP